MKNNQDDNGNAKPGQYYIVFSLEDENYRVIVGDKSTEEQDNTLLFKTYSLEVKALMVKMLWWLIKIRNWLKRTG
ncbi:MAG: hypothetical protein LKM43_05460 [Wolbachia endosymbiont of Penenirmus auritus]|nr:hypothetical protein [Wolbachia endosymbiont of Penenirmus auritus]